MESLDQWAWVVVLVALTSAQCISLLPFWLWTTYQGLDVLADMAMTSDGSASPTKRVAWDQQSAVKCEDGA